jgi:hypothetical protein
MVREVEGSYGAEIVTELFQAKKISTHWYSSKFAVSWRRQNNGWEHNEAVGGDGRSVRMFWCRENSQWLLWCEIQVTFRAALNNCQPRTVVRLVQLISTNRHKPSLKTPNFQSFSCNTTAPGPTPVWREWRVIQSLAGLSYHTHRTVRIWRPDLHL